jgi:dolichol-phosphate mannosyltransferase
MDPRYTLEPLAPESYRISVVLPVYSETETVRDVVRWHREHLGGRLEEIIIVLSPRSGDASRKVCRELADEDPRVIVHIQQQNPGLGRAVREGLARTRGNLVLMMDSDGEMEIETVPRMLAAMEREGCGLVVASRWLRGGGFSGYDPLKYALNWGFQQLVRALYRTPLHDLTYGFKLMRGELARGIAWAGTLHEIACETTLKPLRLGVVAAEVPSTWTARTQGVSKNTFLRNFRYVAMAWSVLAHGVPLNAQARPILRGTTRRKTAARVP